MLDQNALFSRIISEGCTADFVKVGHSQLLVMYSYVRGRYWGSTPTLLPYLTSERRALLSSPGFEPVTLCCCRAGSGNNKGCLLTELMIIPLKAVWCSFSPKLSSATVIYCNSSTTSTETNQTTTNRLPLDSNIVSLHSYISGNVYLFQNKLTI